MDTAKQTKCPLENPPENPEESKPVSLADLEKDFEGRQNGAVTVQDNQAETIIALEKTPKAIEEIKKSTFPPDLRKKFDRIQYDVVNAISCVKEQLGNHFQIVKTTIESVDQGLCKSQGDVENLAEKLNAKLLLEQLRANRKAKLDEFNYREQYAEYIQKRIDDANKLLDNAIKDPTGNCLEKLAKKYAWLWLANDRLTKTRYVQDYFADRYDFDCPKNNTEYQNKLVGAYWDWYKSLSKDQILKWHLENTKRNFDTKSKSVAQSRKNRNEDIIAKAQEAVRTNESKETPQQMQAAAH